MEKKQIVGPDLYYRTGPRSLPSLSYGFIWLPEQSHETQRKSTSQFFKFLVFTFRAENVQNKNTKAYL